MKNIKRGPTYVSLGGEPTRIHTLRKFCAFIPAYTVDVFVNSYGIAEAVSGVSLCRAVDSHIRSFDKVSLETEGVAKQVPCGTADSVELIAAGNASVHVDGCGRYLIVAVDYETGEELPEGRVGEIWIHSVSMGLGYYGWSDEENEKVFECVPTKRLLAEEGMRFMRSGDRGFIHKNGVFLVGRYKQTLIIRGHNYEPSDIEYELGTSHKLVRNGGVIVLSVPNEQTGTDEMVVISEVRNASQLKKEDFEEIAQSMRSSLSLHFSLQCPLIHFAEAKKAVVKTTSGKPKRYLVYERYMKGEIPFVYESRKAVLIVESPVAASDAASDSSASSSSADDSSSSSNGVLSAHINVGEAKEFLAKKLNLSGFSDDEPIISLGLEV